MKINTTTLSVLLLLIGSTAFCQNWQLVWQDEFNGAGQPNPANWNYEVGNGYNPGLPGFQGWGNGEWEWYRPENCYQQGGNLVIRADYSTTPYYNVGGRNWYQKSGRIVTRGKQSWQYGKIEARIKLPTAVGNWCAFWMMGTSITGATHTSNYNPPANYYDIMANNWASCGEIDVMEHVNGGNAGIANCFWDNRIGVYPWTAGQNANYGNTNINYGDVTQFHTYSIEWDATYIKWFLDGVQTHIIDITPAHLEEFRKPFYLIFNMALGGSITGIPNLADFPLYMYVDYVRVYKPGSGGGSCPISPYVSVNGGAWQQTTSISVNTGDNVTIGPQPLNGTWSWTGPNGFSSASRRITLNNLQTNQAGAYKTTYSYNGCTSSLTFNITVSGTGGGTFSKKIEAESYNASAGVIRETCSEGGQNVGSFDTGDWTAYDNITIPTAGTYKVIYRVASPYTSRTLRLEKDDGATNLGTISIPNTGTWQTWTSVSHNVTLPAGTYRLRIATATGGFNINRFNITNNLSARSEMEIMPEIDVQNNFTVASSPNPFEEKSIITVNLPQAGHTKVSIKNGLRDMGDLHNGHLDAGAHQFEFNGSNLPAGIYVCTVTLRGETKLVRIVKNK
jgi:beta-glucanase (GH16 family)